jgi:hypothetical protein
MLVHQRVLSMEKPMVWGTHSLGSLQMNPIEMFPDFDGSLKGKRAAFMNSQKKTYKNQWVKRSPEVLTSDGSQVSSNIGSVVQIQEAHGMLDILWEL